MQQLEETAMLTSASPSGSLQVFYPALTSRVNYGIKNENTKNIGSNSFLFSVIAAVL